MKLAVILVNYNGIKDTIECIDSILDSVYNNFEIKIVVVDNCSINDDFSALNIYGDKVVFIQSKENLGFSGANNIGINYALENDFNYVLLLNNDTVIDKDMINELIYNSNENTVTVPLMCYYNNKNKIWYAGGEISKWSGNNIHNYMDKYINDVDLHKEYCTFATGCCILLPITVICKIGELEENYFMYCEDTEFSIRMNVRGIKILFVPTAKLWHKVSSSTGGGISAFSIYYCTRNRFDYIQKYSDYFRFTAFLFTLYSRYIRLIQYKLKGDLKWKSFYYGIKDFQRRKMGINDYFNS